MNYLLRLHPIIFLLSFFFFRVASPASEAEITLTESVQMRIADAFIEKGEYYRAITEYMKFQILFQNSAKADYALFKIALAYYKGEEYDQAARVASSLREAHPESRFVPQAYYVEGMSHWRLKKREAARQAFAALATTYPDTEFAPRALAAHSLVALEEEDVVASRAALEDFVVRYPEHKNSDRVQEALVLVDQYQNAPTKSQALAGVMSAVVPGSGYLYAEHYGDGVAAFLVNALFIAGTITAADQGNYPVAVIVGGIGLPFYVGNIYGSANAARKWNIGVRTQIYDKASLTLDFVF